jgi:hypothetical protein
MTYLRQAKIHKDATLDRYLNQIAALIMVALLAYWAV